MTDAVWEPSELGVADIHTFLIADVRGYTRFTVEHGDVAAARLATSFAALAGEVISARDGAVIELRGDEALAVFTSARQALRAAVELQARVAEESALRPQEAMKIGIGLDAGEAIPVDDGFRGAALNLAARLCSLAGPGEVLASDTVVSLARRLDGLQYVERGMVPLKGFTDPVRVIQVAPEGVVAEEERPAEAPLPIGGFLGALPASPLIARDAELERVLRPLEAVAGGAGRLVMLAGEPGAGKTRLAQEVTLEARNRSFIVATGSCYEARQSVPYYPFLDALASLYGAAPASLRSSVNLRWPQVGRLLPEAGSGPASFDGEGQQEQERLFRAVAGFVQALAEAGPVALLLDDMHWADASSLELLRHLAKHTRGHRVLIVATYRDVEVGRQHPLEAALLDLTREGLVERLPIRRLDRDGTGALIAATFGQQEISSEFADLVYGHTEGNPFFTQEVLRAMVERGDVFRREGVWDRRALNEIEVPESVRAVVGRRLAQVSDDTQELLRSASVLGAAFTFDDLEAMVGRTEVEIERALEEAIAAGLVREIDRDRYAFNHALTQQSLYSELPSRRRRRLHLAAGDAIEGLPERKRKDRMGELAWHFLEGDDPERALQYSLAAGEEARTVFAWSEAERHFQTALELAEELSDRSRAADARFNLAEMLRASGRFDPALPLFEQAAREYAELDDALGQARALQNAGFLHSQAGRRDTFMVHQETVSQLAARLKTYPPSRELALFYDMYSSSAWSLGHASEGLERIERGLDVARAVGDENLVLHMEVERLERLGTVGRAAEALAESEAIIPRAEAQGDLHALYVAVSNAAENAMFLGRLKDSLDYRRRDAELAARLGQAFESVFALSNLAQIETYLGNLAQARSYAERALSESETLGMGFAARAARVNLGEIAMTVGEWDEAGRVLEEATRSTSGSMQIARYAHREFALLEIATGQPLKAAERLQPFLDNADPNDTDIPFLLPVLSLAYTLIGNTQRGETLARRVLDETPEMALACVDAWPALGIALSRQGRPEEADDAFERGVDLARAMEYPYAEATALSFWGAERGSRGHLEDALAIFRLLGAKKDVERVEALVAEGA